LICNCDPAKLCFHYDVIYAKLGFIMPILWWRWSFSESETRQCPFS
jgi:hypothetical protein